MQLKIQEKMKEKKRLPGKAGFLLVSTVILAVLAVGCGSASTGRSDTARQLVRVKSGNLTGSGVIYKKTSDMLVIVTAAHVLEQSQTNEITFYDGQSVAGESCYVSYSSDLAFINVPLSEMTDSRIEDYLPVNVDKKAFDALQSGAEVSFLGTNQINAEDKENSTEGVVLESWIYVEDFGQYMMLLQGAIYPGMSGGGVFDTENNFLGILCGANEKGEVAAVPLSIIEAEYAGAY